MTEHPSKLALSMKLASGEYVAAMLLYRARHWHQHAKDGWIKHDREWWSREVQEPSMRKLDRALKALRDSDLIETKQDWYRGRKILYLRPTQTALQYLDAGTTWLAAEVFMPGGQIATSGNPSLPPMATLGIATHGNPGLPPVAISNLYEKTVLEPYEKSVCDPSPSASIADDDNEGRYKVSEGEKEQLRALVGTWIDSAATHAPDALPLDGKALGALAMIHDSLAADWREAGPEIVAFAIQHWQRLVEGMKGSAKHKAPQPSPVFLAEHVGEVIAMIAKDGGHVYKDGTWAKADATAA